MHTEKVFKKHDFDGFGNGGKAKTRDNIVVGCKRCGCVKQYWKGKPTYFLNDNVTFKSPICNPKNLKP